jgi:hypothetical protein
LEQGATSRNSSESAAALSSPGGARSVSVGDEGSKGVSGLLSDAHDAWDQAGDVPRLRRSLLEVLLALENLESP